MTVKTASFIISESTVAITTHIREVGLIPVNYSGFGTLSRPSSLCTTLLHWDTQLPITAARCMSCMLKAIKPKSIFAKTHPDAVVTFTEILRRHGRI